MHPRNPAALNIFSILIMSSKVNIFNDRELKASFKLIQNFHKNNAGLFSVIINGSSKNSAHILYKRWGSFEMILRITAILILPQNFGKTACRI